MYIRVHLPPRHRLAHGTWKLATMDSQDAQLPWHQSRLHCNDKKVINVYIAIKVYTKELTTVIVSFSFAIMTCKVVFGNCDSGLIGTT